MKNFVRFLWIMLVFLSLSMALFGAKRGEWMRVKVNAEIICTSCVGLGK